MCTCSGGFTGNGFDCEGKLRILMKNKKTCEVKCYVDKIHRSQVVGKWFCHTLKEYISINTFPTAQMLKIHSIAPKCDVFIAIPI